MDSESSREAFLSLAWIATSLQSATAVCGEPLNSQPAENEVVATGQYQSNGYSKAKRFPIHPWEDGASQVWRMPAN